MKRILACVGLLAACGDGAPSNGDSGIGNDLSIDAASSPDFARMSGDAGPCGAVPALKLTSVATGFANPTSVTGAPGDPTRLYVLEQNGKIKLIKNGAVAATAFLDLTPAVTAFASDGGLLGIAFHPQYATNGRFFVHYSDSAGNSVIAEYARSAGNGDLANPTATKTLFTVATPSKIRFGGALAFGPDGFLYISLGDGSPTGDPMHVALDRSKRLGKILRIDVDNYPAPPPGNLTGANVDPQVWDYGLREPWRLSFDRQTGDLYIGEVGDKAWESIYVEAPGSGGHNYGWSTTEGSHCTTPGCDTTGITMPISEYPNAGGDCAVIGGYVYRGSKNACLVGWYLYSDYCTNTVRALFWAGGAVASQSDITMNIDPAMTLGATSSFGQDSDGELYVVDYGTGVILRIDAR